MHFFNGKLFVGNPWIDSGFFWITVGLTYKLSTYYVKIINVFAYIEKIQIILVDIFSYSIKVNSCIGNL